MNVEKTTLNIIPFELNDIDYDTKTINSIEQGPIDLISSNINLRIGNGDYFKELQNILPITLTKFQIGSEFMGTSSETMMTALGYEPKLEANPKDVNYFIKNSALFKKTKDGKKFFFFDRIQGKNIYVDESNKH